jgi:hypothetical protein
MAQTNFRCGMEFTLKELNQIYLFLLNRPEDSAVKLMNKIESKYKFCWMCQELVLPEKFEAHEQAHLKRFSK